MASNDKSLRIKFEVDQASFAATQRAIRLLTDDVNTLVQSLNKAGQGINVVSGKGTPNQPTAGNSGFVTVGSPGGQQPAIKTVVGFGSGNPFQGIVQGTVAAKDSLRTLTAAVQSAVSAQVAQLQQLVTQINTTAGAFQNLSQKGGGGGGLVDQFGRPMGGGGGGVAPSAPPPVASTPGAVAAQPGGGAGGGQGGGNKGGFFGGMGLTGIIAGGGYAMGGMPGAILGGGLGQLMNRGISAQNAAGGFGSIGGLAGIGGMTATGIGAVLAGVNMLGQMSQSARIANLKESFGGIVREAGVAGEMYGGYKDRTNRVLGGDLSYTMALQRARKTDEWKELESVKLVQARTELARRVANAQGGGLKDRYERIKGDAAGVLSEGEEGRAVTSGLKIPIYKAGIMRPIGYRTVGGGGELSDTARGIGTESPIDIQARMESSRIAPDMMQAQNALIQKEQAKMEIFQDRYLSRAYGEAPGVLSSMRGAGIGNRSRYEDWRERLSRGGWSAEEAVGLRQQFSGVARSFMGSADRYLGAQTGGFHNVGTMYGIGAQYGGGGANFVNMFQGGGRYRGHGLIGGGGVDVTVGSNLGGSVGQMLTSGTFVGDGGAAMREAFGGVFTGNAGEEIVRAREASMGLMAAERRAQGKTAPIQKYLNARAAMDAGLPLGMLQALEQGTISDQAIRAAVNSGNIPTEISSLLGGSKAQQREQLSKYLGSRGDYTFSVMGSNKYAGTDAGKALSEIRSGGFMSAAEKRIQGLHGKAKDRALDRFIGSVSGAYATESGLSLGEATGELRTQIGRLYSAARGRGAHDVTQAGSAEREAFGTAGGVRKTEDIERRKLEAEPTEAELAAGVSLPPGQRGPNNLQKIIRSPLTEPQKIAQEAAATANNFNAAVSTIEHSLERLSRVFSNVANDLGKRYNVAVPK